MQIVRIADAVRYDAPNHYDMRSLRLQGYEATDASNFWVGLSQFLPAGGCHEDATPLEKVYVVLTGALTILQNGTETVLGPLDSCHIPASEAREIRNDTNLPATMLVIMPYPDGAR